MRFTFFVLCFLADTILTAILTPALAADFDFLNCAKSPDQFEFWAHSNGFSTKRNDTTCFGGQALCISGTIEEEKGYLIGTQSTFTIIDLNVGDKVGKYYVDSMRHYRFIFSNQKHQSNSRRVLFSITEALGEPESKIEKITKEQTEKIYKWKTNYADYEINMKITHWGPGVVYTNELNIVFNNCELKKLK